MLVVMAGLPGSGKTTIAVQLSTRLDAVLLSKDEVRSALFRPRFIEYSSKQDDFCIEVILQVAGYILRQYPEIAVIVDGRTFSKRAQLQRVKSAADQFGTALKIIECVCEDETARERIERQQGKHFAANRNFELYQRLKREADRIELPKLILDTDRGNPEDNVRAAELYIRAPN
ncbi:MAG TPA: ATP-binding protein [Chthoniobacterales bacterium]|jgi:adenylylsulfate kinase|nr:ATP-binding protein [Chthoniobacterales bacterium]